MSNNNPTVYFNNSTGHYEVRRGGTNGQLLHHSSSVDTVRKYVNGSALKVNKNKKLSYRRPPEKSTEEKLIERARANDVN